MRDFRRFWVLLLFAGGVISGLAASTPLLPQEQGPGQAAMIAEIEARLETCREMIRSGQNFQEALDLLAQLQARVFTVADHGRQMALAVEVFLLKGIAYSKAGNDGAAVREFKSMLELSPALAREATKNIYDEKINALLRKAEGLELEPEKAPPTAARETVPPAPAQEAAPPPPMAVLVRSAPSEARVFLDGADTGKSTGAELTGITRGPHTIRLVKEFYADWQGPVPIPEAGLPAVIDAKLYAVSYASTGIWGGPESDMFAGPSAVAAPQGNLVYVADIGPAKLRVWSLEGESQAFGRGSEIASLIRPSGLAVDQQGNVYVSDAEAHAILKFDRGGQFVKSWGRFGAGTAGLNTPLGLAVDAPGNVLVADGGNGLVKRFSPEGALIDAFGQEGPDASRLAFPRGVAVNSQGEVVVLDRAQIVIYGRDGQRVAAWGTEGSAEGELSNPKGLAVDALDCVYVADSGNHRVQKFDPRGRFLSAWGGPGGVPAMMNDPCAIAVDARGAVYVAERNNRRIQIFTVGSAALGTQAH